MPFTLAFLNNINGTSIVVLGVIGLLLFGKDLPVMARKLAKEYFRYKRMISDATSDIRREMESAADQIEEETRKLKSEVNASVPSLNDVVDNSSYNGNGSNGYSNGSSAATNGNGSSYAEAPRFEPAAKPAADPLALDVPSLSTHTQRATEAAKSPAASVAQLDTFQKSVPPPSKIPPPL